MAVAAIGASLAALRFYFPSTVHSSVARFLQVAGTRAFMQLMTFIVMTALARELGPAAFGVYAFAIFVGTSLSDLLLGVGMDMAAVRLSAPYWKDHPERAWSVFQLVGGVKISLSLVVLLLGVVGADFIGSVLLRRPEFVVALQTAAVAVLALTLTEFALSILQARQYFGAFVVFGIGVALVRAAPILVMIAVYELTVRLSLTVYVYSLYLGCALALIPSQRSLVSIRGFYRTMPKELFCYAGWMSLIVIFGALSNVMDTLALTYFKGSQAVGMYAAARTFATGVTVLTMASTAVLLPKFGRMTDRRARRQAIRNAVYPIAGFALVLALGMIVTSSHLVRIFYGDHYLEAIPVLQVLACVYSLDLATTPLAVFFLVENRPDVLAKATGIGLLITLVGYFWLVPLIGALGAAIMLLSGRFINTILCLGWLVFAQSFKRLNSRLTRNAVEFP